MEFASPITPRQLEDYLYRHIPLSRAMQVSVVSVGEESLVLRAPLAPNVNHRGAVFGGSASALAMLAGWSLLHARLASAGVRSGLVIRRNTVEYWAPITGEFSARASLVEPGAWDDFIATLLRKGKARIAAAAVLQQGDRAVGELRGEFVALAAEAPEPLCS